MEGFWDILGIVCVILLPLVLADPEGTMNRIGRSIYAFRRGLAGEIVERKDEESQPQGRRDS